MMWRIDLLLYRKEKPLWLRTLLWPLRLLSLPYGWAIRIRCFLYQHGLLSGRRLPRPVICVGNITAGGSGKTPLVMALAEGLREREISVAILSRGYKGRKGRGSLVSDGRAVLVSPEESGDEPYLMAKSLKNIPVLVGKDRFSTGRIAIERFGVQALLLDDGYQHLQLRRDLNILLIDAQTGFGDGHLLPRGILREPLSHLRRADLFLLTKVEDPQACQRLEARLRQFHPSAPVFHSHFEPRGLVGPRNEWEKLHTLKGKRVLAFSGIANPSYFSSLLKKSGMEITRELVFPDHHLYSQKDLALIREKGKGADRVVTTEKDMVKLKDFDIGPVCLRALSISVRIWEEEAFFQRVMELFQGKS